MDENKLFLDDPEGPLVRLVPREQAFEHKVMGFPKLCLRELEASKSPVEHLGECHGEAQVLEQLAPLIMEQQVPLALPDLLHGGDLLQAAGAVLLVP
jgi:hypothetical protein